MKDIATRLREKLSDPENVRRLFDALDRDAAFKPYWPEMLDFTLPENAQAELDELDAYRAGWRAEQTSNAYEMIPAADPPRPHCGGQSGRETGRDRIISVQQAPPEVSPEARQEARAALEAPDGPTRWPLRLTGAGDLGHLLGPGPGHRRYFPDRQISSIGDLERPVDR